MFKLSIIVPAVGPQEDLDNTLLSVLENRPASCELLVPHSDSYRDPYDLSDEVTFVPCQSNELASLINAGVEASQGEVVHILLSGVVATEGWTDAALAHLQAAPHVAAVAALLLDPTNPARITGGGIRYARGGTKHIVGAGGRLRRRASTCRVDGPNLQAAFFRRDALRQTGRLTGCFGSYHIDTDYAARLRAAQLICEHVTDCRLVAQLPPAPRGFSAGRRAEQLYWQHASTSGSLVRHLIAVGLETISKLPRPSALTGLLGRAWGMLRPADDDSSNVDDSAVPDVISLKLSDAARRPGTASASPSQPYSKSA